MLDTSLVDGWLPILVLGIAFACAVVQVVRRPSRPFLIALGVALGTALIVQTVLVLVVDHLVVPFGIPLEFRNWCWVLAGLVGWALAGVGFVRTGWWRKTVALVAVPVSALAVSLGVNLTYGQYPTLRDALGLTSYPELPDALQRGSDLPLDEWDPPSGLAAQGSVYSVAIPGKLSGFPARDAAVYLPPAALADDPPRLPVLMAMAGQPGAPTDVFTSGQLAAIADSWAEQHDGVAPVIVVPDQLGTEHDNPMCVDGAFGDSRTYLERDVRDWVLGNLPVSEDRASWVVAGFSQGGTCALQLATGSPELFGAFVDIAGDEGPTLGTPDRTLREGFGGDAAAYAAARPTEYLAGETLHDTAALLVVGDLDPVMG
ncbi:MAG TPA: alpha/beta hydrolase-fold protein, partial [Naasia sp.]